MNQVFKTKLKNKFCGNEWGLVVRQQKLPQLLNNCTFHTSAARAEVHEPTQDLMVLRLKFYICSLMSQIFWKRSLFFNINAVLCFLHLYFYWFVFAVDTVMPCWVMSFVQSLVRLVQRPALFLFHFCSLNR